MEWMWNAMWARFGWALGELVLILLLISPLLLLLVRQSISRAIKQYRCDHPSTFKSGLAGSQLSCSKCGKYMGPAPDLLKARLEANPPPF